MYVVERGVVVVTDANDRVVARAKDGDVVGERSLMGSERRALRATVNVDANAPASLLELRRVRVTLVPVRPRRRGELHSLRTFSPGVRYSPPNPRWFQRPTL